MRPHLIPALLLLALPSFTAVAQGEWEFRKEQNGIRISTREVPGSPLKATRAETVFDAPVGNCVSVLKDVEHFTTLFPSCTYSERISTSGDTLQTQYVKLKAPWPVTDRDYAFMYFFRKGPSKGSVNVVTKCMPSAYPLDPSMIRLDRGDGKWTFTPVSGGRTRLVYEFHGTPGGSVPAWLANSTVVDSPLSMLENFHRMVKEKRHQGKSYRFIQ
ncbi:MAG: hypothetical protein K9J06_03420 [Flavobacteriales bacterium]|nr:hypothetical protein [Flavobacteriales bacterium]